MPKFVVIGAPGIGKTTICEALVAEYNLVRVNYQELMIHEANLTGSSGSLETLKTELTFPEAMSRGWVIDDVDSIEYAKYLVDNGLFPDVVINLTVPLNESQQISYDRVSGRRVDVATYKIFHTTHKPAPPELTDNLIMLPRDTSLDQEQFQKSIRAYHSKMEDITAMFGGEVVVKAIDASKSIYRVQAESVLVSRGMKPNGKYKHPK